MCPSDARYPVLGALYHPPGAIARHDAVAWGYAKEAMKRGVEMHTQTEVEAILIEKGRAIGVKTSRGTISAGKVLQAVAGSSSIVRARWRASSCRSAPSRCRRACRSR